MPTVATTATKGTAGWAGPAEGGVSVSPHDTNDLVKACKALYVGVAGDIKVDHVDGSTITYKNVPVGVFPIMCSRVYSTGTGASQIIALY